MGQTVYIKLNKSVRVDNEDVCVSDVASVYCEDKHMCAKIKSLRVLKFSDDKSRRYVVSVLKIIELIAKAYPGTAIESDGEQDVVIEHSDRQGKGKFMECIKVALVCLITLIGGGFAVMAYNNDVGMSDMFTRIYGLVLGEGVDGHRIMEISYSIGLAIGIIVFYGHFGNWKFGKDPTPLEVEMRMYEDEVDTAMIKQSDREGTEIDVD